MKRLKVVLASSSFQDATAGTVETWKHFHSNKNAAKQIKMISISASWKTETFGCVLMRLLWRLGSTEEHN